MLTATLAVAMTMMWRAIALLSLLRAPPCSLPRRRPLIVADGAVLETERPVSSPTLHAGLGNLSLAACTSRLTWYGLRRGRSACGVSGKYTDEKIGEGAMGAAPRASHARYGA